MAPDFEASMRLEEMKCVFNHLQTGISYCGREMPSLQLHPALQLQNLNTIQSFYPSSNLHVVYGDMTTMPAHPTAGFMG